MQSDTQENNNDSASSSRNRVVGFELNKCDDTHAVQQPYVHRIRDQLACKTKELQSASSEITTLRSKLAAATKAIETLSTERDASKERCTKLTGLCCRAATVTIHDTRDRSGKGSAAPTGARPKGCPATAARPGQCQRGSRQGR